jgi:hypothetical protein
MEHRVETYYLYMTISGKQVVILLINKFPIFFMENIGSFLLSAGAS